MLGRGLPPIGVGIDICKISRIYQNLTSPMASKFIQRILSPEERGMPYPSSILKHVYTPSGLEHIRENQMRNAAQFMAGRFAAKEAVIKACHLRKLSFHDVVVTYQNHLSTPTENETRSESSGTENQQSDSQDKPGKRIGGRGPPVAIIKGDGFNENVYARLSISHDGDYATAICLTMLDQHEVETPGDAE